MYINISIDKFINEYIDYYVKIMYLSIIGIFCLQILSVLQIYVREVYIIQNINADYLI